MQVFAVATFLSEENYLVGDSAALPTQINNWAAMQGANDIQKAKTYLVTLSPQDANYDLLSNEITANETQQTSAAATTFGANEIQETDAGAKTESNDVEMEVDVEMGVDVRHSIFYAYPTEVQLTAKYNKDRIWSRIFPENHKNFSRARASKGISAHFTYKGLRIRWPVDIDGLCMPSIDDRLV